MVKTQGFLVPLSICQNYFLVLPLRKLFESRFIRSTVKTVNPYLNSLNVIVRATRATSRLELSCWPAPLSEISTNFSEVIVFLFR